MSCPARISKKLLPRAGRKARTLNNGQSCIAAKRFVVAEAIADQVEKKFVQKMEELRLGDPFDEKTDVGPLAAADAVASLHEDVQKPVEAGGRILIGGRPAPLNGNYHLPTALGDVPENSPADKEEFFGPVASLFRVRKLDEAICIANDTRFGLGASAWTNDETEQTKFIDELEAGMVFLNQLVASDPRVPSMGKVGYCEGELPMIWWYNNSTLCHSLTVYG